MAMKNRTSCHRVFLSTCYKCQKARFVFPTTLLSWLLPSSQEWINFAGVRFCPCNGRKRRKKRNETTWVFHGACVSLRTADLHSYRDVCSVNYGAEAELCRVWLWACNALITKHLTFLRIGASTARSAAGVDAGLTTFHPSLYRAQASHVRVGWAPCCWPAVAVLVQGKQCCSKAKEQIKWLLKIILAKSKTNTSPPHKTQSFCKQKMGRKKRAALI